MNLKTYNMFSKLIITFSLCIFAQVQAIDSAPQSNSKTVLKGSVSLRKNNGETIHCSRNNVFVFKLETANKILERMEPAAALIGQSKSLLKSDADLSAKLANIQALKQLTEAMIIIAGMPVQKIATDSNGDFKINDLEAGSYAIVSSFSTDTLVAFWVEKAKVVDSTPNEVTLTSQNAFFVNQIQ